MPRRTIETLLIFSLFAVYAGQLPPDVNESHYLTKAKHGWDPLWCPDDIFLSSSFSHWLFYQLFGWLNQFFSLPMVAWIGRILTWLLLAFGWQRLSDSLLKTPGLSVAAAAIFLVLNDRFHLAGEWVVGGFEAKGLAYFFVLMALGSFVRKDSCWLWPYLGFACAFHVLVGGWATIAVLISLAGQFLLRTQTTTETRLGESGYVTRLSESSITSDSDESKSIGTSWQKQTVFILAGLVLAAVGALPPLLADFSADPNIKATASKIYVQGRISHHLVFNAFTASRVAGFSILLVIFGVVGSQLKTLDVQTKSCWQRLFGFALGSLCISFGGLMLSGVSEHDAWAQTSFGLLRFYWFRMADFAVPCATSLGLIALLQLLWQQRWWGRGIVVASGIAIALAIGWIDIDRNSDPRPRADRAALPNDPDSQGRTMGTYRNWVRVCEWIKNNTPADAQFITPSEQQTFQMVCSASRGC